MSGVAGVEREELLLVPYRRAIAMLSGRDITLTIIMPPYPALGCGTLRVVRAAEVGNAVHLEATYDDFERLT